MTATIDPPAVRVGITTRNRAAPLRKAIASARAQKWPNLLISVLDDGSTDDVRSVAADFPEVAWDRNEVAQGIIEARNRLMKLEADYYVSLDDDAWFLRGDEIATAVTYMEANRDVAAVAFDILSADRAEPVPRGVPRPTGMFIGCGHVLRLSAVREAGFYAPTPGMYGSEEKDLSLRLLDLGCRIVVLPGVHVWHDKAWDGRDWYPLHKSGVCNDLSMALRRCPLPDLLLVLPYKILSHLRFGVKRREMLRPALAGVGSFFYNVPAVIAGRSPVSRRVFRLAAGR